MLIQAATFTVISQIALPQEINGNSTRDIYKFNSKEHSVELIKTPSSEIKLIGTLLTPSLIFGKNLTELPSINPIDAALIKAGISLEDGNRNLSIAKGILAEMNFPAIKITPELINDPDEDIEYLNIKLHIHASFENALELDSLLTKSLLSRVEKLPERITFAVYNLG